MYTFATTSPPRQDMLTEPIAIYHLRAKIISRSKGQSSLAGAAYRSGGHSATHAAAYRSGERLTDARTGRTFDYGRKQGIIHTEILVPKDAPVWASDRAQLWNTVELTEKRKDAQLAREIELSLPPDVRTLFANAGNHSILRGFAGTGPCPPADHSTQALVKV